MQYASFSFRASNSKSVGAFYKTSDPDFHAGIKSVRAVQFPVIFRVAAKKRFRIARAHDVKIVSFGGKA